MVNWERTAQFSYRCMQKLRELFVSGLIILLPVHAVAATAHYKVGVFDNRPIIFEQSPGHYAGISVDLLDSIEAQEDIKFDYVYGAWKDVLGKLEDGEIDLIVGIAYTPERAENFDYTRETLLNNWGVVYRKPSVAITSLADLKGKRVAMMDRSVHSRVFKELMDKFQFNFTEVKAPTYLAAMKAVEDGEADAAVINRVISLLNAPDYSVVDTGIIFNPVEVRFATLKARHPALLALIDKYLAEEKQDPASAYNRSLSKWLTVSPKTHFPAWLLYVSGVVVFILLFLAFSNYLIRKQVAKRTMELTESETRFRQLADNINEIFWIGTPDWRQMLYVSPAYERLWGQKVESLYANPMLWLESIHPDDRAAVRDDLQKKIAGDLSDPAFPEYRIFTESGETLWISARAYPIRDKHGNITRIAGIAEDITNRKAAEASIKFLAHHDPLTKLMNRFAFENELVQLIEDSPNNNHQHALLYIDLDQFKVVNDTCGHGAGDKMLARLGKLLNDAVESHGMIARLGGDEFGVIIKDANLARAKQISQEILDTIKDFRFVVADKKFSVGASIGLVMIDTDQLSKVDLLSAADMACYAAKERGRNRIHVFTHDDTEMLQRRREMQWVSRINNALEEDRLVLYRQEIRALQKSSSSPVCHEYLVRLLDEDGHLVMPGSFIPAAERFELMPKIDRWVIRKVFAHLKENAGKPSGEKSSPVAFINLSGQVFADEHFFKYISAELQNAEIDPRYVCFEITETAAIGNLKEAGDFIRQLRTLGFKFALDDFGTGMSSFSYLQSLQIDFVKIDGVFIKDLLKNPMNIAIVESITKISHQANLEVIAEWIESGEVLENLVQIGVDFGQGFAIGKPVELTAASNVTVLHKKKS
ncbi:MAG: EAL domain-containing protein [Gammaproteobacteria bacterium]|nr:EAL domain-containing protein [Gammaproteobacteria bacterium]